MKIITLHHIIFLSLCFLAAPGAIAQNVAQPQVAERTIEQKDSQDEARQQAHDSLFGQVPEQSQKNLTAGEMPPPELGVNDTTPQINPDKHLTNYALILFALGAVVGVYLLSLVLRNKQRPLFIAGLHGVLVVTGLVMLIIYALKHPGPVTAIVIFGVAALGGLIMFFTDITGKPVPKWLAIVHGLAALAGFGVLAYFVFTPQ